MIRKTGAQITLQPFLVSERLCACGLSGTAGKFLILCELINHFITDALGFVLFNTVSFLFSGLILLHTINNPQLKSVLGSFSLPGQLLYLDAFLFLFINCCAVKFQLCSPSMLAAWCKEKPCEERQPLKLFHFIAQGGFAQFYIFRMPYEKAPRNISIWKAPILILKLLRTTKEK